MTPSASTPNGPAALRWRRLVRARLAETRRLSGSADFGAAFWDPRARRFAKQTAGTAATDPMLARVRSVTGPDDRIVDVGCGPGRFSLALAPDVAEVVGVDPSPMMLSLLRRQARRERLDNITTVEGRWQDVQVEADVGLCSYVLPLIEDAAAFLAKLDAACRRHVFLYLSGFSTTDALFDPLWRYFHDNPRKPGPTYLDAVAVLSELGVTARVEIVELPMRTRFDSPAAAARAYRENLLLADSPEVRKELRRLLSTWLVKSEGKLRPPLQTTPAAIVRWSPRRGRRVHA